MSLAPASAGCAGVAERTLRGRVTAALSRVGGLEMWRDVSAVIVAVVAFAGVSGGLFYFARSLQMGLFVGLCTALVARRAWLAASIAAVVTGVGMYLMPSLLVPSSAVVPLDAGIAALTAAVAGWLVRRGLAARPARARWFLWFGIGLLIVNLWATTIAWDSMSIDSRSELGALPPLWAQLEGQDVGTKDDAYLYITTLQRMRQGMSFYDAYRATHLEWNGVPPAEVWGFRQPLLYWFWMLVPGGGWGLIAAFLTMVTAAVMAAYVIGTSVVRPPLALPGLAALTAQFLQTATGRSSLVYAESWAVCLVLVSIAAYVLSRRSDKRAPWLVLAVACATVAALFRELTAPLLVGGLAAAVLCSHDRREAAAWGAGLAVFATAYIAHAVRVSGVLTHGRNSLATAGLANVVSGLRWSQNSIGATAWFPLALSIVGIIAIALYPARPEKWMMGIYATALMTSWFFVTNNARSPLTGESGFNYWGETVVPVLYAAAPALFAVVPGMAVNRSVRRAG